MSISTLPVACAASTWKIDALLAADVADRDHVLDHADLVVHEHHAREDGVGADRRLELLEVEQAVFLHVEVGDLEALALELAHGVEHGLVLGLHRDQVLALALVELRRALDARGCSTRWRPRSRRSRAGRR